jgi:hypothetical protein
MLHPDPLLRGFSQLLSDPLLDLRQLCLDLFPDLLVTCFFFRCSTVNSFSDSCGHHAPETSIS